MEKLVSTVDGYKGRIYEEMAKLGEYFSSKYGISPSTAISVILGCVCMYMFARNRLFRESKKRKPVLERSKSFARLYGGDLALRRLEDYRIAHALPYTLDRSDAVLKGLLEEEHLDLRKLQSVVSRLEMAGMDEDGVKILQYAKNKNKGKSHHVYEIEMLLAEMLIYKGELEEALKCECLDHEEIELDARRPLLKAIINGIRGKWEEAEREWNKFMELRESIKKEAVDYLEAEGESPRITDFNKFKERIKHVRNEIVRKYSLPKK